MQLGPIQVLDHRSIDRFHSGPRSQKYKCRPFRSWTVVIQLSPIMALDCRNTGTVGPIHVLDYKYTEKSNSGPRLQKYRSFPCRY